MSEMARELILGGVEILQLRAKHASSTLILKMAATILPVCREAGVPFLLNDHPELVPESGADGAHVGQDDMTVEEARRLAGPGALIGRSTHSLEQAFATAAEYPDYIGFGPLFSTPTKPDYTAVGTETVGEVLRGVALPVFCIGGIKESNLKKVVAAGADRVAIVSELLLADDPRAKASACRSLLPD